jgi:G:T-mismatch repair DNA endonuclease (very short patch repair protein)
MFTCTICSKDLTSYKAFQNHNSKQHKISGAQTYVNVNFRGQWPTCQCGCKEKLNFQGGKFGKFIRGHSVRLKGGFYTENGSVKSAETRRQRFASGEIVQWNKGKKYTTDQYDKILVGIKKLERCRKISQALTGRKKTSEQISAIQKDRKEYWGKQENRDAQRERRMQFIISNGLGYSSKLEKYFESLLKGLNVEYYTQFYAKDIKALYDFKIKGKNILIEVDGDYWHCNPSISELKEPSLPWHFDNLRRDEIKNTWAKDNGYVLLRFWEHDCYHNTDKVIEELNGYLQY